MSDDLYQFTIVAGEVTAYAEEDDGGMGRRGYRQRHDLHHRRLMA